MRLHKVGYFYAFDLYLFLRIAVGYARTTVLYAYPTEQVGKFYAFYANVRISVSYARPSAGYFTRAGWLIPCILYFLLRSSSTPTE